jgi:PAP2 superfamily
MLTLLHAASHGLRLAALLAVLPLAARADVVTDWNLKAGEIVAAHQPGPSGSATMALVQTAVYDAVNAVTRRYPKAVSPTLNPAPGTSIEAAIAAANRTVLLKLAPSQERAIEAAYQAALGRVADGPGKADGVALGEQAVTELIARRAVKPADTVYYRPVTRPGMYVPTVVPLNGDAVPVTLCWVLDRVDQFRPGPPPELTSAVWTRDYNEVKAMGARSGSRRTPEQTNIARFWTTVGPAVYFPLARSLATQPGREVTRNARFLAVFAQVGVDAIDAVFDAKYTYQFWRPFTAIRNGDQDGNDATERDASWLPFIDTPMHPEYPCAHCTAAGAYGAVLQAEIGTEPAPPLSSVSPTLPGATRTWVSVSAFVQEVSNARIYDGVHYRNSAEVGTALGRQVGELAVSKLMR